MARVEADCELPQDKVCIVHIMNTCLGRESCFPRRKRFYMKQMDPSSTAMGCSVCCLPRLLPRVLAADVSQSSPCLGIALGTAVGHFLDSHHAPLQRQPISKDQCANTKTDLFASI